jgi:hypothetical protein
MSKSPGFCMKFMDDDHLLRSRLLQLDLGINLQTSSSVLQCLHQIDTPMLADVCIHFSG